MSTTNEATKTRTERVRQASRARRDQARQELRQTILDAAAALFLDEGYKDFSMRQVAELIGYSATTIYRYFKDKDDLLFAVVDQGFERFRAELARAARSTDDPSERLGAIGRAYVRFGRENPLYYQMMFMQRADYLCVPPEGSDQPRIASFLVLQTAVQAALDAGRIRPGDAREHSNTLWAFVHGIVSLGITMPEISASDDAFVDRALRMIFEGMQAQ